MSLQIHQNIKDKLGFFYESHKIPNLLFHGATGSGKRTIVNEFISKIYDGDKDKLKAFVMFVNCSHGKGIKFIRDELKFFAKTNLQSNSGVKFKSIVLFNADSLTNDAQSALRRCIEIFSYNTRFFIIVENKHKLLNPILSRFCEIYVPEYICKNTIISNDNSGTSFGQILENLHQYHLKRKFDTNAMDTEKREWFVDILNNIHVPEYSHKNMLDICTSIYENGYSCLDLIQFVNQSTLWSELEKSSIVLCFHKIKSEFRCEKLLLLYMLDFIYLRDDNNIENIYFI